jgi:hypothetical protein
MCVCACVCIYIRVEPCSFLGEHLFSCNVTKELAPIDKVEDETELVVRLEGEMQLHNERMVDNLYEEEDTCI